MTHDFLEYQLQAYRRFWCADSEGPGRDEALRIAEFSSLMEHPAAAYNREYFSPGHFTSSALIVSPDYRKTLLTLHAKLGKWLQLGGHADGEPALINVARREVKEEAGIVVGQPIAYAPEFADLVLFDIDCHSIPERKSEPQHYHFDARFVFVANPEEPLRISEESIDLRWFTLEDAKKQCANETSMLRLFAKVDALRLNSSSLAARFNVHGNAVRADLPFVE